MSPVAKMVVGFVATLIVTFLTDHGFNVPDGVENLLGELISAIVVAALVYITPNRPQLAHGA